WGVAEDVADVAADGEAKLVVVAGLPVGGVLSRRARVERALALLHPRGERREPAARGRRRREREEGRLDHVGRRSLPQVAAEEKLRAALREAVAHAHRRAV